jgi:hypothetical protein
MQMPLFMDFPYFQYCSWILTRLLYLTVDFICKYTTLEGHTVLLLVEALRYKLEGHGFDYRRSHWNFSLTFLPATLCPWG